MTKEEKDQVIEDFKGRILEYGNFYVTDIADLNVETTSRLRRECFNQNISLYVVKNTLLEKALERVGKDYEGLPNVLKGSTSIMFSTSTTAPAKLIKEFRKKIKSGKPMLKGAYVQESVFIGDAQLDALINMKSKEQMIGEVISLLQSPAQNVIGALQSGGNKLAGIVKTLSEKEN